MSGTGREDTTGEGLMATAAATSSASSCSGVELLGPTPESCCCVCCPSKVVLLDSDNRTSPKLVPELREATELLCSAGIELVGVALLEASVLPPTPN
jgi:hypothetical protein